jgi:transposase
MIKKLIEVIFDKQLKRRKVREILIKDFGWTNQKPMFKAYQQNPEKVKQWKEETLPMIKEEARKEKREIFY